MNRQLFIIARREFLQRVRSKGFIIITLLGPLLMLGLIAVPILIQVAAGGDRARTLGLDDRTGVLAARYLELPDEFARRAEARPESLRVMVERGDIDGLLELPADLLDGGASARYYSRGGGGLASMNALERSVERAVRTYRIERAGIADSIVAVVTTDVDLDAIQLTEEGEQKNTGPILAAIGYVMGLLIYIFMLLYGAFVMRGVIEEKTNRISELIASSARPFELMMGKVLGIGSMGLVQFGAWLIIGAGLMMFGGTIVASFVDPVALGADASASPEELMEAAGVSIPTIPWTMPVLFLLYFLGGYFLYASLYAAVGSAVEQESDAQQFLLPVMLPIILPMFFIGHVITTPSSTLSVILSIVPFSSPILMPVRIAAAAATPLEIVASLVLLLLGFLGAIWISARVYRVGILMYGKKPRFKDLIRWIRAA